MARRGKYGQLPGASPNLTSTIIAIARQMESERESNLMDAWKNGGTFEGKPATDEMVLAFWKERLTTVDKADPQYDTYKNTLTQTDYAIHESKMSTWYAQSKGDASADRRMAEFYTGWAKRIPKDSEFYRVLQRDGAQFIRSALAKDKAASGGGGGGGGHGKGKGGLTKAQLKAQAYNDAQSKTFVGHEQLGTFLTSTLTTIAKGQGLIGEADSQGLTKFDPSDPSKMLDVISQINKNPKAVVYMTPQGAVTGQAILDVIKTIDPHFDGKLTVDYYGRALADQVVGQHLRLDLATATKHKVDMNALKKGISATTELGRESNAWPIEQSYQTLRNNWLKTWSDPTATPDQKVAAWATYSKGLVALATSKTHPPDQNTFTRIIAEVQGKGNVDSLAENFSGQQAGDHSSVNGAPTGDIADTHASLANLYAQQQAVATGQAVWANGTTASDGTFHPGVGREIGAATAADVHAASPEGAIQVWINQSDGKPIPVWVAGKPVTAQVVDSNGNGVGATNPDAKQVATAYDVSIDGHTTTIYGYQSPTGVTMYTTDAPWGPNVQSHDTGSAVNLVVRLSAPVSEASVGSDPNFTVTKNEKGDVTSITVDPGRFVLTETDPVRYHAGADPHTDSMSPSVAYHLGTPEGQTELATLAKNPGFSHTVDVDLRLAAGGQYDAATGYVVGGDPALYNEGAAQVGFASRMNDPRTLGMGPAGGEVFFGRSDTRGAFEVMPPSQSPSARSGSPDVPQGTYPATLPSDQARGTLFSPLAALFQKGTNRLLPNSEPKDSLLIQGPQQLRLPQAPAPADVAPGTYPVPAPIPLASPTAPTAPIVPPGPTDKLTPTPVPPAPAPVPVPAASQGLGSQDMVTSGVTATPTAPKPKTSLPQPLPPKTGQRPV